MLESKQFINEIAVNVKIRPHNNIVQFLGVCKSPLAIVTEYFPNGNLRSFLNTKSNVIDSNLEMGWVVGIAGGMLHLTKEGIIHKDLCCQNVLLTAALEPKITDFGLSGTKGGNFNGFYFFFFFQICRLQKCTKKPPA